MTGQKAVSSLPSACLWPESYFQARGERHCFWSIDQDQTPGHDGRPRRQATTDTVANRSEFCFRRGMTVTRRKISLT